MAASNKTKKIFGFLTVLSSAGALAGLVTTIIQMVKPDVMPLAPEHRTEIQRAVKEELDRRK